jgi:hypothetical protein
VNRRSLIGGVAVSILAAGVAQATPTTVKADGLYPYLKMYLETAPAQRDRFLLAYYAMRGHKPAPDVKAFLVGANGARRPIAIAGDGRVQTLPSLAELNGNIQVEFDAAPGDKISPNLRAWTPMHCSWPWPRPMPLSPPMPGFWPSPRRN